MSTRRGLKALVALASLTAGSLFAIAPLAFAKDPKVIVFPGRDAAVAPIDASISKIPPDPPAMVARKQWVFDLKWTQGDPFLLGVHPLDLGAPQATPRAMGRFAIELFEGPTLIERVRFDFPMLGAPPTPDAGWQTPPSFEAKLTSRIGVVFPATDRGTRLELWDRATNKRWALPWPIEEKSDGGGAGAEAGR